MPQISNSIEQPAPYRDRVLNLGKLRELIRAARGGFAPDHVARAIRQTEPGCTERDAIGVADLLRDLVATAARRLHDAGIEPMFEDRPDKRRLPKREREHVSNVAVLLTELSAAMLIAGRCDDAKTFGLEGIAWCRTSDDYWQMSVLWRILSEVHVVMGEFDESDAARERSVASARASNDALLIVAALNCHAIHLVSKFRIDESERVITDAFELIDSVLPDREACQHYGMLATSKARICIVREQYPEGIRMLREAVRWASPEYHPQTRAMALTQLGAIYLRLARYGEAIACQHETARIAEDCGLHQSIGWANLRLGAVYTALKQFDDAARAFDRAEEVAEMGPFELALSIALDRTKMHMAMERWDDAAECCQWLGNRLDDSRLPFFTWFVAQTMGAIERRRQRYDAAEAHLRRAIDFTTITMPHYVNDATIALAQVLHEAGRDDEALTLVEDAAASTALTPVQQLTITKLRVAVAEAHDDMRSAMAYEREAFALERILLERQAEESLRNVRIMAEVDLLERQANLERERRRHAERELATTIVKLGDHGRTLQKAQERLRVAIAKAGSEQERSALTAVRETLAMLHRGAQSHTVLLHYLSDADEDAQARLDARFPGLTSKQKRLCALVRSGMQSKEIAAAIGVGQDGLKAQRKRLRRKMGLAEEDSLEHVLASL